MTSRRMQLKKEGHGLVVEANQSALLGERGGLNKKGSVLENGGEHWSIVITKNKHSAASCVNSNVLKRSLQSKGLKGYPQQEISKIHWSWKQHFLKSMENLNFDLTYIFTLQDIGM